MECQQCLKKFTTKQSLQYHIKNKVCKKKDFSCDNCGIVLSGKQSKQRHEKVCGTKKYELRKIKDSKRRQINYWFYHKKINRQFLINLCKNNCHFCNKELDYGELSPNKAVLKINPIMLICFECDLIKF